MELLTTNQLAEHTGIPERRIYALVRDGLIPVVKLGRQVRFAKQAIEKWIADGGTALPGGWKREPEGEGAAS